MVVFVQSPAVSGGGVTAVKVYPVIDSCYEESVIEERLIDAAHRGDLRLAVECLSGGGGDEFRYVDVNYVGAVWLRSRRAVVELREEEADEVKFDIEEIRTEASPLFLAAHAGCLPLVRKLLSVGADVNQKLFRGYATTAAVRQGRADILESLLKAGASQPACEEAFVEACCHGRAKLAEMIMSSDLIRSNVAVHGLVSASSRGFVNVVDSLIKCGVDANATDRVLLQSLKPSLHTNVDCTPLAAAIVSRQATAVRQLLQGGVNRDTKVRLGAWSWDTATGEELRVGAGLAEPYSMAWCAVEYFESTGTILRMLLQHQVLNSFHCGRTLLHHAVLCGNARALEVLLNFGADREIAVKTTSGKREFRPIHMAAHLGHHSVLQSLIKYGCEINSRTENGETALMLAAKYKHVECVKVLLMGGADLALVSADGVSATLMAAANCWSTRFECAILDVILAGKIPCSSNQSIFSPIMFAASCGDVAAIDALLLHPQIDIDEQDENGFSPIMVAAKEGHVDAFRFLVFSGANVKLANNVGKTAIELSQSSENRDLFEQVMLEFALKKGNAGGFQALHCAARRGDLAAVRLLTNQGYNVNIINEDGCTPLMLAAREGHSKVCEILISCGAKCDIITPRGETALSMARSNKVFGSEAERVILDELGRQLVLKGGKVKKHTKCGKGSPHDKELRMLAAAGILHWGSSSRRNVVCSVAEIGGSSAFQQNRRKKGDAYEAGLFRVLTTKGREVHFVCQGGDEEAEMWVRGIRSLTRTVAGKVAS